MSRAICKSSVPLKVVSAICWPTLTKKVLPPSDSGTSCLVLFCDIIQRNQRSKNTDICNFHNDQIEYAFQYFFIVFQDF